MSKKYFLTSVLLAGFIAPAYAADDNFITGGAGTCTVDVLKVSDNNATANTIAVWTPVTYECAPGQYLVSELDGIVGCTMCPTGSYCPGGNYTVEDDNKGTEPCPSGYAFSDAGAKSNTQCYTACTVASANIAHATAVTGNDYYGTGVDTCGATACETGYHVDGGGIELVEKTPLAPISLTGGGEGYRYVNAGGTSSSEGAVDAIPADSVTAPNTWAASFSDGVVYGKASCQPKVDAGMEYIIANESSLMSGEISIEDFKTVMLPLAGQVKTDFAVEILTGVMTGSISMEEMYKALWRVFMTEANANYSTDSVGLYCYCQMDGFMPTGGTKEAIVSAPWVFVSDYGLADYCASGCANNCAFFLQYDDVATRAFRAAVVGALDLVKSPAICAANKINIDWNPNNGGEHIEGMCYYNDAITLPAEPTKPGYTFTGWKLVK